MDGGRRLTTALPATLLAGALCALVVYRLRSRRRRPRSVRAAWLVDRIAPGASEKRVPFLVTAQPRPEADLPFKYRVVLRSTGQSCAEGDGFAGVPVHVDLSRTGFGTYVLEVDACVAGGLACAEVDKRLVSFKEEIATKRVVAKEPVRTVSGWPACVEAPLAVDDGRAWSSQELASSVQQGKWYLAVDALVYDVGAFARTHPGGVRSLMQTLGRDCTETFNLIHEHVDHRAILGSVCIGRLR
mmetsp:Transcript_2064/g.5004  ORF Transcript_2064/g.5004 Transcript_2064/m.5004 type:complete len:243 (+) Transcript_2064:82-810(+)